MFQRHAIALTCFAAMLAATSAAKAQPVITFEGLPAQFTPGEDIAFTVRLVRAENLAAYNIELLLSADGGVIGSDFGFTGATKPASRYVFNPDDDLFHTAINLIYSDGDAEPDYHGLTLSDLLLAGSQSTVADVNDLVAHVTVTTSADFTGDLSLLIAPDTLELTDFDFEPIVGVDALLANLPQATIFVPEPASAAMLALGTLLMLRRRR